MINEISATLVWILTLGHASNKHILILITAYINCTIRILEYYTFRIRGCIHTWSTIKQKLLKKFNWIMSKSISKRGNCKPIKLTACLLTNNPVLGSTLFCFIMLNFLLVSKMKFIGYKVSLFLVLHRSKRTYNRTKCIGIVCQVSDE